MAARIPMQPSSKFLRLFGWFVAGALALAGHLVFPSPAGLVLQLVGAAIFAVGTVRPRALLGLYWVLSVVLWPLTWLYTRLGGPDLSGWVNGERRPRRPRSRRKPATS